MDSIQGDIYNYLKKSIFGKLIIIVAILVVVVFTIWNSLPDRTKTSIFSTDEPVNVTPSNLIYEEVPQRVAPLVTFRDGIIASVGFSITTSVEEKDVVLLVSKSGSREVAENSLVDRSISAVIAELEKRTISEVRKSRSEIEELIMIKLQNDYSELGLTLDSISILEIIEK